MKRRNRNEAGKEGSRNSVLKMTLSQVLILLLAGAFFSAPAERALADASYYVEDDGTVHYTVTESIYWNDIILGRQLYGGDTLTIENGATVTFAAPYFGGVDTIAYGFNDNDPGGRHGADIAVSGGAISAIAGQGSSKAGAYIDPSYPSAITFSGTDLKFTDFTYGLYAPNTQAVINITNNTTQFENAYIGLYANNGQIHIQSGSVRMTGSYFEYAAGSSSVNIEADRLDLTAGVLAYSTGRARTLLTARQAGTLQGDIGAYGSSAVTLSLGGSAAWTGGSEKAAGSDVTVSLKTGTSWYVRPVTDGSAVKFSEVSLIRLDGGTADLTTSPAFQKLTAGELTGSGGLFRLRAERDEEGSVDQVTLGRDASGSTGIYVPPSGTADMGEGQAATYLVRQASGAGTFALTNAGRQVELGLYMYRLASRQTDSGTEWYLTKSSGGNDPVDPVTPENPVTPEGPAAPADPAPAGGGTPRLSPTGRAEAALSALAGHYAMWSAQLTDLRKRLGEVRYGPATGLWTRGFADSARLEGFRDTTFTQTTFGASMGYDLPVFESGRSRLTAGMQLRSALAHQHVNGSWGGHGDLKSMGCGLYATWVHGDGWYADAVGTIDWYSHKIRTHMTDGTSVHDDRNSYGTGASLEAGRRMDFAYSNEGKDYWFLEPELALSWFWVKGGDFEASNGMVIGQKDMSSLTGRAGLVLGHKFAMEGGNGSHYVQPYVKGGVNHEFLGRQKASINNEDMTASLRGTRVYYGAGADWQAADSLRLYMQAERESGDHYTREYNVSVGVKWDF